MLYLWKQTRLPLLTNESNFHWNGLCCLINNWISATYNVLMYIHSCSASFLQEGSSCKLHQVSAKDNKYRLGTMIRNWLTNYIGIYQLTLCAETFGPIVTVWLGWLSILGDFLFWHGILSVCEHFCPCALSVPGHFLSLDTFCPWTLSVLGHFLSWDTFCPGTLSVLGHFQFYDTFCLETLFVLFGTTYFSISLACLTKIDNRAHHLC